MIMEVALHLWADTFYSFHIREMISGPASITNPETGSCPAPGSRGSVPGVVSGFRRV